MPNGFFKSRQVCTGNSVVSRISAASRCFVFWLVILVPCTALNGQTGGAEFLRLGAGGRALSMGGAYVALADDPSAAVWNPAGLARVAGLQGYLSHMTVFSSQASHNFASGSVEINDGLVLGLSWVRLSVDDIPRFSALQGSRYDRLRDRPEWRSDGASEGVFRSVDDALFFSFARRFRLELLFGQGLTPVAVPVEISFGMNMKLIRRALDVASASAQSLDLGMIISLGGRATGTGRQQSLSFGISVFDIAGSRMNWNTGTDYADPLPMRLVAGVGLTRALPGRNNTLALSVAQDVLQLQLPRLGVEYQIGRVLALRGGYRATGWSAGAGLNFGKVMLDYAFSTHELGATHRVGGGARF